MTSSNLAHQLRQHQVDELQEMTLELGTLSDLAHTIWYAIKQDFGDDNSIAGTQHDLANRTHHLHQKLKAFTDERNAECKGFAQLELEVTHA